MLCLLLLVSGACASVSEQNNSNATMTLQSRTAEFDRDVIRVADNVYVANGFGVSTISMIVGDDGVIIIDTGNGVPYARDALAEFRKITELPVAAVILTHSHADHIGGIDVFAEAGEAPQIWAHKDYGSEDGAFNSAGLTAARVRGMRQAGFRLPPEKRINNGIAPALYPPMAQPGKQTNAFGMRSAKAKPTHRLDKPRQALVIAGVALELVEAPGETNDQLYVMLPETGVVFSGDNFYKSWPNLYAIRGTPYRDVDAWANAIDRMLDEKPRVLVGGHTRPIVGEAEVRDVMTNYRDAIRYVFEKTIEGMNRGMTPNELVAYAALPEKWSQLDYLKPYYGNPEWAVRSIFTGYLGWFDGNPTNLFSLTPVEEARHMAELAGGSERLLQRAQEAFAAGNAQWAAQLCDHLIALDENAAEPKLLKAQALETLAQDLLTATGRNYYLTVAQELRQAAE